MTELKELSNNLEVVGLLKTKELEEKTTKSGMQAVMGSVVVEWNDAGNIQNTRLSVFVSKFKKNGELSKLYTSINTVMNEYKDIDTFGREDADLIQVTGNVDKNEYVTENGELRSSNRFRAVFFHRLEDRDVGQKALATVEMLVQGYTEEVDSEQVPTGKTNVEAYTIGYNNTIIPLCNLQVPEALKDDFENLYLPGSTGKLTVKINNYAIETEKEVDVAVEHGFGSTETVEDNTFNEYISNLEILGGNMPLEEGQALDASQIKMLLDQRKQDLAELKASVSKEDVTGFGSNKLPQDTQDAINKASSEIFDGVPEF